jgi:hypothetical protein
MRQAHSTLLLALLFLFLSQIVPAQSNGYETYQAPDFSINYPAGWRVDDTETKAANAIFFFSPLESDADKFSENINVLKQDLSNHPMTLKEYTDLSLQQIKTLATNGKLLTSKTIHTANGDAQKLIYTADHGQFHLKFQQLYVIIKSQAYLITYTAEIKSFKKYLAKANEAFDSFRLKQ